MTSKEFADKINKYKKLMDENILNEEEYNGMVKKIIAVLSRVKISEVKEDFLFGLIPIIKNKSVSDDQFSEIKNIVLSNASDGFNEVEKEETT
ncbi:MAG: hypothetical protein ACOYN6_06695 [Ignavibacteria bacterium]